MDQQDIRRNDLTILVLITVQSGYNYIGICWPKNNVLINVHAIIAPSTDVLLSYTLEFGWSFIGVIPSFAT